eukprot:CAMPEP_0115728636 /NCGR_PEP_ID=MMETSP0272-20121206/83082_1 /TAXON_ID=71861 /ORGANISM="Scrippsiella trochoidea, Strain CCMP3099" /LENGTH=81 /DNA_ID=CAMNT_0003172269 /DNA_START=12 /DNA_END=258 /DNA_ORIENTATION=-
MGWPPAMIDTALLKLVSGAKASTRPSRVLPGTASGKPHCPLPSKPLHKGSRWSGSVEEEARQGQSKESLESEASEGETEAT